MVRKKHKRTLNAIFNVPVPANISWSDIESLLYALDGIISEREGSRVAMFLNDRVSVFHKPHQKETPKGTVKAVRRFLEGADITPEDE